MVRIVKADEQYKLTPPADFSSGDILCSCCGVELWVEPEKSIVRGYLNPNANSSWNQVEHIYHAYKIIWPDLIYNQDTILPELTCPMCNTVGQWATVGFGILDLDKLKSSLRILCCKCSSPGSSQTPLTRIKSDDKFYCLECALEV